MSEKLNLSPAGAKLYEKAIEVCKEELGRFDRVRTRFYYPKGAGVESVELRTLVDDIVKEFNIDIPYEDRESKYFQVVHTRLFDILNMKIHRLSPDNYLVVTHRRDGKIIFIIRDAVISKTSNIRLTWSDKDLDRAFIDSIPMHLSRENIEIYENDVKP